MSTTFADTASEIAEIGRIFYSRGWVLGTSGNFSSVLNRDPLRLAITATSVDKGTITPTQILEIDAGGRTPSPDGPQPSEECLIHLEVVRHRRAGAVLHTHSVWSTVLSNRFAGEGGISIQGYEMLKGLEGIRTPDHREWLPIVENDPNSAMLAARVKDLLNRHRDVHGFLIRRHGMYSWGADLKRAKRHVEILEFLLEAVGSEISVGLLR